MEISQINYGGIEKEVGLKFSGQNIGDVISELTKNYVLLIAGLLLLIYLIIGGFQYLTSSGDPKKTQEAQAKITQALLGFFIVFGAFWLVQLLASILGLEKIKQLFKFGRTIRDDLMP